MKTNDMIKKTGLSKQTILYYEKEGLIHPLRDDNGYRNYSKQDEQVLILIKLLRSMNVGIDDIKMVIDQQLSFQDCLTNQQSYLENTITEMEQVKKKVEFYKEKHIPMIPALEQFDQIAHTNLLGYNKTTSTITIGLKPTRSYFIKKLVTWFMIALILALLIGKISYFSLILFLLFYSLEILGYGLGIGEMGMFTIEDNATHFIEFNEQGIAFLEKPTFKVRISYLVNTLKRKELLKQVDYEDIIKVEMKTVERYMKIPGSNIATPHASYDFYFTFKDGSTYSLIHPILLEQDLSMLKMILKEKVENCIGF